MAGLLRAWSPVAGLLRAWSPSPAPRLTAVSRNCGALTWLTLPTHVPRLRPQGSGAARAQGGCVLFSFVLMEIRHYLRATFQAEKPCKTLELLLPNQVVQHKGLCYLRPSSGFRSVLQRTRAIAIPILSQIFLGCHCINFPESLPSSFRIEFCLLLTEKQNKTLPFSEVWP